MLRGCNWLSCSLRSHEIFGGREFLGIIGGSVPFHSVSGVFGGWGFLGFLAKSGLRGGNDVGTLMLEL